MVKHKGFLQRLSQVFAVLSFILSVVSAVWLYLQVGEAGWDNPVSASLLASIFFFVSVGVVLTVIGRSNLPSLKP
ncbi:MAG: hemerythrin family protein [Pseudomonadota bacterium]